MLKGVRREFKTEDGSVWLMEGDSREVVAQLTDIGSVVTDPPFGYAFSSGWEGPNQGKQIEGDSDTSVRDEVLSIVKDIPALVFGSWKRPVLKAKQAIVWNKGPASGMGDLSIPWKESFELIFVCGRGFNGFRDEGIINGHTIVTWASKGRLHPNQKPVGLLEELVLKSPGIICDPFMGSGTTGIACIRTGRKFIGIEIDPTHYDTAVNRIQSELSRTALLEPVAKVTQRSLLEEP